MSLDLRKRQCGDEIARVEAALSVTFDPSTEVRKRRSVGFRTDRDTWVRLEMRPVEKIDAQGWNGTETAGVLQGVSKPEWLQGIAWNEPEHGVMWRADETELVTSATIKPGGTLSTEPDLSDEWWRTLNASFDALASHATSRVAVTQERFSSLIERVFPGQVDTAVDEWTAAHADMAWANLTAPECWLLDWEDWGLAPRGYDSASLWRESLAVPNLAQRVYTERKHDLDTRSGKLSMLFACAVIMDAGTDYAGVRLEPAREHTARLITELA